jgi:hypothetical protein
MPVGFPKKKPERPSLMETPLIDGSAGRLGVPVSSDSEDAKDLRAQIAKYNYAKAAEADNDLQSPAGSFGDSVATGTGNQFRALWLRALGRGEESDTVSRVNQAQQSVAGKRDAELAEALTGDGMNKLPLADSVPGFIRGAAQSGAQAIAAAPAGPAGMAALFAATTGNDAYVQGKDRGLRGASLVEHVAVQGGLEAGIMLAFGAAGRGGAEKVIASIGKDKASAAITG